MSSVNKVILVGRVGKNPEVKHLDSGKSVANFSLATSEKYNNTESTEWHNIVIWGKLVPVVESYVKKGDQIYLEGKKVTRSWDKDGDTRYVTEIVCNQMTMLGGKSQQQQPSQESAYNVDNDLLF